jgi:hypothetical protein
MRFTIARLRQNLGAEVIATGDVIGPMLQAQARFSRLWPSRLCAAKHRDNTNHNRRLTYCWEKLFFQLPGILPSIGEDSHLHETLYNKPLQALQLGILLSEQLN